MVDDHAAHDDEFEPEWWFNVLTQQVEEGPQSLGNERLGPFRSREEAEHAEEIIAERARVWNDEQD